MTEFDFSASPPFKVNTGAFKSSGEKFVEMNVFDAQMVDARMIFHAEGHETGLNLLVTEITWPAHNVTRPHRHELEDEGLFMLDGSLTVLHGRPDRDRHALDLAKGEFGWSPRGGWHEINVGPEGAHVLLIQTPGSQLSTYFRIIGSEVGDIETPEEFAALNDYSDENFGIRFWDGPE